ncbi:nucleoside hydrolase [Kocuria sp.]|uniref:nucleoside hydrolase n=1 Tax=Kocuria sp. TaxID=1871328 RepID=UPI0026DF7769|nr:nucleoside hydrolase [Kocuria sp.]MDO5617887.1 nucleoside hydrolase [Kocuria sp.]
MTRKVLIDCDPGVDDALALMLAHGSPEIDVLAVTTCGGNQTLEKVTRNALSLADELGMDWIPVAAGAARPLVREPLTAGHVHGDTGLGLVELPDPQHTLDERHAVEVIAQTVLGQEPGEVTIIATGPLTNLALAIRQYPDIVEHVQEVVLMGGGVNTGNLTPVAEFNIAVDPEAARAVFTAGWPVTMVGLDTTHQALATPEVEAQFAALDTRLGDIAVELIRSYRDAYKNNQAFDNPPCHDPVAVARVIAPELVKVRRAPVDVELRGELTTGQTVVDLRSPEPQGCPTSVSTDLDHAGFWDLVVDAVRNLGEPTSRGKQA